MIWITLEEIKQQLRLGSSDTSLDAQLTRWGNSAEAYVLNWTRRTVAELKAMYPTGDTTQIPADVWEATVMLVANSYEHGEPASERQLYTIPYGVDAKLQPYRKGTYSSVEEDE
jgi:hypothetical protein